MDIIEFGSNRRGAFAAVINQQPHLRSYHAKPNTIPVPPPPKKPSTKEQRSPTKLMAFILPASSRRQTILGGTQARTDIGPTALCRRLKD
jgi:hypothetical protein